MRLLIAAAEWFPDWKGGNARVITETARRLAQAGHEVTVIAPSVDDAPAVETHGTLTLRRVIRRGRMPITISDFAQAVRHGLQEKHASYDLVVAHSTMALCGFWLARVAPSVLVFHAPGPREIRYERKRLPYGPRRAAGAAIAPLIKTFEFASTEIAVKIFVLSEFSRSVLLEDYPRTFDRIIRVSGGVDIATFSEGDGVENARHRLGIAPGPPLLFTARRLEPRMGLENLVLAIAALRRRMPVRLTIVGGGSLDASLHKLAADAGVADCVQFAGRVTDADLADWYRAADVFVLPTAAYEGFGLVTAEALASGTPVVGTPVGATPELLTTLDPRLIARSPSADDIAATIEEVLALTGPAFRRRCREHAENYSWDAVMPLWERGLEEALEASRNVRRLRCGRRRARQ